MTVLESTLFSSRRWTSPRSLADGARLSSVGLIVASVGKACTEQCVLKSGLKPVASNTTHTVAWGIAMISHLVAEVGW